MLKTVMEINRMFQFRDEAVINFPENKADSFNSGVMNLY